MTHNYLLLSEGVPVAIYESEEAAMLHLLNLPHYADEFVCLVALPLNPRLSVSRGMVAPIVEDRAGVGAASVASGTHPAVTLSLYNNKIPTSLSEGGK